MEETVTQYRRLEEICNNEDDQINFLAIYETLAEALHINPDVCINWREQFDTVLEEMFSEARIEPICMSAVRACIDERFAMILTELKFHKRKPFQRLKESFDKVDDQTLVESLQKCYNEEAVLLKKLNKTPLEHLQMQCDKTIPLIDQKLTEIGNAEIVAQLEEVLAVLREIYQELKVLTEKLHTEINVYHDIVYQAILETVPLDEQLLPTLANLCKRLNSSLSAFILIVCQLCTIKDIFQFIRELADQSYQLLLEQIKNCFVIESNCATLKSQMLKLTNNRSKDLDVDLRGLGMASLLECGIISFPQQVTINFYSEEDIGTKAKPVFPQMKDTAPLLKSVNDDLRSEFKEVHLGVPKKTTPPTKQHLVTDFMYYLTFTVKIKTCFNDFPDVDIDVHYKPVVIISQTSQSNAAMGTLKWNCLARNKDLIGEREHITWDELEKYLREWWFKETTAQLTQEHLLYLRQRLPLDTDLNVITKSIIMKELINNDLTFWKWFSSCVNLVTHENVDQEYKQGHIVGFISRDAAIRTLVNEKPFTFLVRFSENECQASQKEKPMAVLVVSIVYFHQAIPVVEHVKKMFNGKNTYLHEGQLRFNLISMEFDQNGRHRLLQHISKRDSKVEPYKEKYDKGFNNSEYTPALYQTLVPLKHSCDEVPAPEKEELDATRGDNQHMEGPLPPGYLDQEPALSPEDFPDLFTEGGQPVQLFPDSTMTEADSVFLTPPYQENSPLMPQVSPNDVSDDLSNNMNSAEWLIENMEDLSGNCEMQTA